MYFQDKRKKGISIVVGYVLLVTFAIVIGAIVYSWMKSYVPQEEINCPDGASLFLEDYSYNCDTEILTLYLKNNGRFSLGGYFVYVTNKEDAKLATIDISKNNTDPNARLTPTGVKFGGIGSVNYLEAGQEEVDYFNLTGINQIYSIEILPIRWQEEKNKQILATCKTVKVREASVKCKDVAGASSQCTFPAISPCTGLECGTIANGSCGDIICAPNNCDAGEHCGGGICVLDTCTGAPVPNDKDSLCGIYECGFVANGSCGNVFCGDNNGACIAPETCDAATHTCECATESDATFCTRLGAECGTLTGTDNCGVLRLNVNCGGCDADETCNNNICECVPETNVQFCTRLGVQCGSLSGTDNCGNSRTVSECGPCSGVQVCNRGICVTPSTCNGTWVKSPPETVECDGTPLPPHCLAGCSCEAGYDSSGGGGCWISGTGASCQAHCISLGYTQIPVGSCRQNQAQCNSFCPGIIPGVLETGGNQWCTAPTINCCCCQ